MIPIDYHLHSTHSIDGEADMPEMCEAAIACGLTEICFTEHVDFDRTDPGYGHLNWEAYNGSISEVRAQHAGRLVIRTGLEFDFRRAYGAEVGEVLAAMPCDLRIGSVHSAGGHLLFGLHREPPDRLDVRSLQKEYFAEVEALVASGWCHSLGHFDYLYKQLPAVFGPHRDAWYWERVERILSQCVAGGVALELNTHHVLDSASPCVAGYAEQGRGLAMAADVAILRRYRAVGGRLLTVGSDAHRRGDVAHAFAEAERCLRDAGFDAVTGFERGRPYAVALA